MKPEYIIGALTGARYLVSKFEGGSTATSQYIVEAGSQGLTCNCPAFDFDVGRAKRARRQPTCKHCKMVQDKLDQGEL